MAQQIGLLKITGTIGSICFYRRDDLYYARAKSSLTGQRVKRDPAFAKTMAYAELLGTASKIAAQRYRQTVPKAERSRGKYRELVGMVLRELREETTESQRKIQRQNREQHEWTRKDVELLATDKRRRTQIQYHQIPSCIDTAEDKHEWTRKDVELTATDERRRTQMVLRCRSRCHERHELTRRFRRHRLTRMNTDTLRRRSAYHHEKPSCVKTSEGKHEWTRRDVELLATDQHRRTHIQHHELHEQTRKFAEV